MNLKQELLRYYTYILGVILFILSLTALTLTGDVRHISMFLMAPAAFFLCFEIPPLVDKIDQSDFGHTIWMPALFVGISVLAVFISWVLTPSIIFTQSQTLMSNNQKAGCFYQMLQLNLQAWSNCADMIPMIFRENLLFTPWLFGVIAIVGRILIDRAVEETKEEYKKLLDRIFGEKS